MLSSQVWVWPGSICKIVIAKGLGEKWQKMAKKRNQQLKEK